MRYTAWRGAAQQFQGGIIVSVDSRSTMGPYIGERVIYVMLFVRKFRTAYVPRLHVWPSLVCWWPVARGSHRMLYCVDVDMLCFSVQHSSCQCLRCYYALAAVRYVPLKKGAVEVLPTVDGEQPSENVVHALARGSRFPALFNLSRSRCSCPPAPIFLIHYPPIWRHYSIGYGKEGD